MNLAIALLVLALPDGRMQIEAWDDKPQIWWHGAGTYQLQASTNCSDWIALTNLTGDRGFYYFQDDSRGPRRFYRWQRL